MKKVVVIIICVLFVASVLVVNFFGMKMAMFPTTKYVEKIECLTLTRSDGKEYKYTKIDDDGIKRFVIRDYVDGTYDENNIAENRNTFILNYGMFPDDADNKKPTFVYDKTAIQGAFVIREEMASVVVLRPNRGVYITIRSSDGSDRTERIYIVVIPA